MADPKERASYRELVPVLRRVLEGHFEFLCVCFLTPFWTIARGTNYCAKFG